MTNFFFKKSNKTKENIWHNIRYNSRKDPLLKKRQIGAEIGWKKKKIITIGNVREHIGELS